MVNEMRLWFFAVVGLALWQVTAFAGQRHYGLRDCRYRWLPLVSPLENFKEIRSTDKPNNRQLFSYVQENGPQKASLSAQLYPSSSTNEVSLENTIQSVLGTFYANDPNLMVEAIAPEALEHRHHQDPRQAIIRQLISPATRSWAQLAFVALPNEVFVLELLATDQDQYNKALPAFEKIMHQFFLSLQDGPRYNITACETLDR